jgi:tetratricopeptide (TPR) repeat protein
LLVTPAAMPSGPSPHDLALVAFERGLAALQRRNLGDAISVFTSILDAYPDEKELQERARVYLAICERQSASTGRQPRTLEERMNAATVAINSGAFEEALELLRALDRDDGENDLVQYMLAVVYAALGEADEAISRLRQAVELNPENRFLALQDADLAPLREHADFIALLESAPALRRPASRARSGR